MPETEFVNCEDYTGRTTSGRPFPCSFCGEGVTGPGVSMSGATGPKVDLHVECVGPLAEALLDDSRILGV